jgi:endoglucanase
MRPVHRYTLMLLLALAGLLGGGVTASASSFDSNGFRFSSGSYTVHESAGAATITITRQDTRQEAQIRYIATHLTALPDQDYRPVKGMIDFQPGQGSATFQVPIVDHHMSGPARTIKLGLFGPSPIGLSQPKNAVLTIINDDQVSLVRDITNPLALSVTPPASDPLTGARPYIDWKWGLAAWQARKWRHSHPRWASMLDVIAREPEVHRFGNWVPRNQIATKVSQYLEQASIQEPGTVPEFATYWLNWYHCGNAADPAWRVHAWHQWMTNLAAGISGYRVIVFLEMDGLITTGCLSHRGLDIRLAELHYAISLLSRLPHVVAYVDAGAADAIAAPRMARLLRRSGVASIQGFFVNSTHYDWTSNEIRYGERISRMIGGKHFVVSTSANGRGPLAPSSRARYGNEVICNPPGRGLGPKPTFRTGYPNVDAFAWIGNPGKSGGTCRPGAPPVGVFWPALALSLVRNAVFQVR